MCQCFRDLDASNVARKECSCFFCPWTILYMNHVQFPRSLHRIKITPEARRHFDRGIRKRHGFHVSPTARRIVNKRHSVLHYSHRDEFVNPFARSSSANKWYRHTYTCEIFFPSSFKSARFPFCFSVQLEL